MEDRVVLEAGESLVDALSARVLAIDVGSSFSPLLRSSEQWLLCRFVARQVCDRSCGRLCGVHARGKCFFSASLCTVR